MKEKECFVYSEFMFNGVSPSAAIVFVDSVLSAGSG